MTTLTAKPFEGLKAGIYPAHLQGYEESSGEYGPSIKLIWALDGMTKADGEQATKWQWVSQKLSPRSNLWSICSTLGKTPVLNEEYDLDDLIGPFVGKAAQLIIKMVDGPNGPQDKITDIMAFEGDGAPPPAQFAERAAPAAKKPATQAASATCDVDDCSAAVDRYTKKGKALCAEHDAEDL